MKLVNMRTIMYNFVGDMSKKYFERSEMIDSATISIQYIKKDDFTGSYKGMRYRLSKVGDGMEVIIWPGPYNFIKTLEQKKQRKEFSLTIDGKEEAVRWLNEQYEVQKPLWDSALD